ncbi:hypothetical protein G6011_05533 [Alternaria panax]|uniref:Uncharacterized protein n=1 Tax=Alternaria panax TaxID=48097 RepID=A0AAD4I6T5_9PLEO|nr:hypothetical protein G6011_05533 [Alternaria panax]
MGARRNSNAAAPPKRKTGIDEYVDKLKYGHVAEARKRLVGNVEAKRRKDSMEKQLGQSTDPMETMIKIKTLQRDRSRKFTESSGGVKQKRKRADDDDDEFAPRKKKKKKKKDNRKVAIPRMSMLSIVIGCVPVASANALLAPNADVDVMNINSVPGLTPVPFAPTADEL